MKIKNAEHYCLHNFLFHYLVFLSIGLFLTIQVSAQSISVTVHLQGVNESKISIMALSSANQFSVIDEFQGIKNGQTIKFLVSKELLPGEFVLRFDYNEKKDGLPYPSEKQILINDQNLELWVNPLYCNNEDSTKFQQDEKENKAFRLFVLDNARQKDKIGLLQQFLMNYDDTKSKLYREGIDEYEKRRQNYNIWLKNRVQKDMKLFASSLYTFQYIPKITWEGNERERILNLIQHYFDGINFDDENITRTSLLNDWMNTYVNLYGQMATTETLRDSLVLKAAFNAIEKAKHGHSMVYGWMVDYFYRGFEINNIPSGMIILKQYLGDPKCKTTKRREIERRIKGAETLTSGTRSPNIELIEQSGVSFNLHQYDPETKYILILFWSAQCNHCTDAVDEIILLQKEPKIKQKLAIIAISLDETEDEIAIWNKKTREIPDWKHLRAAEGVRSKVASDYFILSTPVLILLDTNTKQIISIPSTINQLLVEVAN